MPRSLQTNTDTIKFESVVLPGETADIVVTPQALFRGEKFEVAAECAEHFGIVDVTVNAENQRPRDAWWRRAFRWVLRRARPALPAAMFAQDTLGAAWRWRTAMPGRPIILRVVNQSSESQIFSANAIGRVVL